MDPYCVSGEEHVLDDVEVETVVMNKGVSSKFLLSVGVPSKFANSASGGGWKKKVEVSRPNTVGGGRIRMLKSLRSLKRGQSSGGMGLVGGGMAVSPVKRREGEGGAGSPGVGSPQRVGSPDSIPGFSFTAASGSPYGLKKRGGEGGGSARKNKKKKAAGAAEKIKLRAVRTLERKTEEQKMDNMAFLNKDVLGSNIGGVKAKISQPTVVWDKTIGRYKQDE